MSLAETAVEEDMPRSAGVASAFDGEADLGQGSNRLPRPIADVGRPILIPKIHYSPLSCLKQLCVKRRHGFPLCTSLPCRHFLPRLLKARTRTCSSTALFRKEETPVCSWCRDVSMDVVRGLQYFAMPSSSRSDLERTLGRSSCGNCRSRMGRKRHNAARSLVIPITAWRDWSRR